MEIHEVRTWLGPTPARVLFEGRPEVAGGRGTVLFYHGITASKDVHDKELVSLARRGFLAVGLDNQLHGERLDPRFAPGAPRGGRSYWRDFTHAQRGTAMEIPKVIDALVEHGLCDPGRIGVAGISMGGAIAYAAPLADHRVQAVATLAASPRWSFEVPGSPHFYPERFFPVAMLSQIGECDEVVQVDAALALHEGMYPHYQEAPHRLELIMYQGAGHAFPGHQWDQAWERLLSWFEQFLRRETVERPPW